MQSAKELDAVPMTFDPKDVRTRIGGMNQEKTHVI
jgi:hypothetical protein